jgi:hypothetical protein
VEGTASAPFEKVEGGGAASIVLEAAEKVDSQVEGSGAGVASTMLMLIERDALR